MPFPKTRLRRLRRSPALRDALTETRLHPSQLIAPFFVKPGKNIRNPIPSMPGQFQLSLDQLEREVADVVRHGIRLVLLFGIPAVKNLKATDAYSPKGIVQQAVRLLKKKFPDLYVITDLCFCEYTSHGHCGFLKGKGLDNDVTLEWIARTAVVQARAGADMIAPSGMIDGMVRAIRTALDQHGYSHIPVLSYASKFASAFYGPFRDAAESAPRFGDRKSYQMNSANAREALREMAEDVAEGADAVMVKPALAYLDVITRARARFDLPLVAYNVSGEYAMVKAAAAKGWIDEPNLVNEILGGIRRAGADLIITYHAKEWAAAYRRRG